MLETPTDRSHAAGTGTSPLRALQIRGTPHGGAWPEGGGTLPRRDGRGERGMLMSAGAAFLPGLSESPWEPGPEQLVYLDDLLGHGGYLEGYERGLPARITSASWLQETEAALESGCPHCS